MNPTQIQARAALTLTRRLRRLRRSETIRAMVRETRLTPDIFVLPLFVCEGEGVRREVASMPGVYQLSVDEAVKEAEAARADGVKSVLLFGLPDQKDDIGSAAYDPEAPVQSAIRAIKRAAPDVLVVTDVCLCEYTDHGHCGILMDEEIVNDATVEQLVRAAVSHAAAGADIVAPSDMMDGRVGAIRAALDERGFVGVAIMSYAAKYCSAFYGPFRDAAGSAPKFGDRRTHQMDPANAREALREVEQDIAEGADIVMVKPALPYLDIVSRVKETFGYPTAAYHTSGEYSMLKAAARNGWLDEPRAMLECLTSIRRAGADIIITYYARDAARAISWFQRQFITKTRRTRSTRRPLGPDLRVLRDLRVFAMNNESNEYAYHVSKKMFARASRILPGGVDSPVRAFTAVGGSPLFIRRAHGARLEDVDGNTFIDYVMSWGPLIHGHAPAGLVRALARAARNGTSFGAPSPFEVELGERVRRLMPSIERVRFVNSGTEAAMSAVRVARAATGRERIVKFEGCYHGHADSFLVAAGSAALTFGVPTSPGVTRGAANDTLIASYNDLDSVHRLFDAHRDYIAALIVEPIAGNMGLVPPADGFLRALREVTAAHGTVLIFDEVISGFRAAPGGAQALADVRPDLTCLGKIIGGGLPVGAYGGRADLMALVSPEGPVYQAGTLSGNPLAMTAGIWALDQLRPKLYQNLAALGARLAAGLADAARDAGVAVQVNAVGSLLTPFFTSRPVHDYASATSANTEHYGRFFRGMIARGVYPPPSQFEAWFLSAAHTVKDIDSTIGAARAAMRDVAAGAG